MDIDSMMLEMDHKLPSDPFSNLPFHNKTPLFSDFSPNSNLPLSPFFNPILSDNPVIPEPNPYDKRSSMAAMREMIFRIASLQPVYIDPESIKPPKRRNVRISKDPQSVAARHRRERISEKIRILQRLVPGGTKMDTASMLDEAVHYVKFLKKQVQALEQAGGVNSKMPLLGFSGSMINNNNTSLNCANLNYSSALFKACQQSQMVGSLQMH